MGGERTWNRGLGKSDSIGLGCDAKNNSEVQKNNKHPEECGRKPQFPENHLSEKLV